MVRQRSIPAHRLLLASVLLLSAACGSSQQKQETFDDSSSTKGTTGTFKAKPNESAESRKRLILIPTNVSKKEQATLALAGGGRQVSFGLASATTYSITMDGCASGFGSTATQASTDLQVYVYDQGCVAKLTEFTINGITYSATATGATDFSSWDANQTATFANTALATDLVNVKVISQLTATVDPTDTVQYSFYDIEKGADNTTLTANVVGDGHGMTVGGQAAPDFTIKSVRYVGMNVDGSGKFEFSLECSVDLTNAGTTCKDATLTQIDYLLVEDTFGSTLSLAQADGLSWPGTSVAAGDKVAIGGTDQDSNTLAHGGFYTDDATPLNGPITVYTKPHMILILRANGLSYQYFNVDVATIVQN